MIKSTQTTMNVSQERWEKIMEKNTTIDKGTLIFAMFYAVAPPLLCLCAIAWMFITWFSQ